MYNPEYSIGTVTATDTFSIDFSQIYKVGDTDVDSILIDHIDDGISEWTTVPHDQLKGYDTGHYCSVINNDLVFNRVFTADDPQFGGEITIPAYSIPPVLVAGTDSIPVDDPNWLVFACAAELVRNDIVKQNQYPNILQEANNAMQKMKDNNEAQIEKVIMRPVARGREW